MSSRVLHFSAVDESPAALWKKDIRQLIKKLRLLLAMKTRLIIPRIKHERKKILQRQYDIEVVAKEGFCTIFTACGDSRRK